MIVPEEYIASIEKFFSRYLPLTNPVLILAVTLLIILFAPLIFRRIKIPGIIGLIIAGMLIGPNCLHLIESTNSFELLASTGLLYIMFLAGLEIDMQEFRHNRHKSLVFGAFTFLIPLLVGYFAAIHIFHFTTWPALLLASIFSTHTLLSYPIVSNMGVVKNRAVQVTFGGTIITDSAALILLGFITNVVTGGVDGVFWFRVAFSMGLLLFATLYLLPRTSRWFFRHIESHASSHYIFVLAVVFISGFLSEIAGVEPIIGAFLAGLGLNKVIPHSGILMNRINFIGNTLFIPFFLISAGMLVDVRLFFSGTDALFFAGTLCLIGVLTKYLAAWLTGTIYKYRRYETNLMFGLSVSHAAATLAIIKVGFDLGLFSQTVINATILLILISCLISSFVSERAARKVAIGEKEVVRRVHEKNERILIPVSNPDNIHRLIDLALLIKDPNSPEPIYPLSIVEDDAEADEKINIVRKVAESVAEQIASGDKKVEVLKKVDLSIVDGIVRTARAYNISDILISQRSQQSGSNLLFSNKSTNLLTKSRQSIVISKILQPLNTFNRVIVILTPNCELENGFARAAQKIATLLRQLGAETHIYGRRTSLDDFSAIAGDKSKKFHHYRSVAGFEDFEPLDQVRADDLYVFLTARKQTLSYDFPVEEIARKLNRQNEFTSFILFYPEIPKTLQEGTIGEIGATAIEQSYAQVKNLTGKLSHIFKKEDEEEAEENGNGDNSQRTSEG